ncbi:4-hydroxy-tetrahydrodipicolinate synthase [Patescibacteria group bacterium]|nr:4-hydroxy-tetrahydrodipicolinate synthase [Patescibacteria group bacterium]
MEIGRLVTAMVTPFREDGGVDLERARLLAKALVASGSDGLVVTGTTGENPVLFHEENVKLWAAVKNAVGDTAAVIAGSGTNGTDESVHLSREAKEAGADALLLVVPYYNKPTQEGLYLHFRTIAESVELPCILYNVPSRTIVNMTAETTLRLAEVSNIVGVKEASGDFHQIGEIIRNAPDGFKVWSGNDSDTFGVLSLGGYGVVSVASHLIGQQIKRLINLTVEGRLQKAASEHLRQLPLAKGLFVVTSPIPVKYCLNEVGFPVGGLRLPLVEADPQTAAFLDELLEGYEIDLPLDVVS